MPEQNSSGGIVGSEARSLIRLFGEPRLDIRDPAARKLQFSDGRCILDAYLYPSRAPRSAVVTYAEARRMDGTTMDVTTCMDQLKSIERMDQARIIMARGAKQSSGAALMIAAPLQASQ